MSEYAKVVDGIVVTVVVIDDSWSEEKTQASLPKGTWVKTVSKVGKGFEYHKEAKIFSRKKPYESWTLDKKRGIYLPPIPRILSVPVGYIVYWSEEVGNWIIEKAKR